ncbi:MAG: hypothetical protein IKH38_00280 [Clostridia bacterium]|nr:hypothetical protein [Clostridia bacterium]
MPVRAVQSIFCYAYQAGPEGRGFSVNVYNNDTLAFSLYDERRQMLSEECFTLDRGTHLRILQLIRRAERDWLNSFPTRMARWDTPRHISRIGLDSHALFQLEDLEELMQLPFRTQRGHFGRLMFNLLEDVSAILLSQGFELSIRSFTWYRDDPRVRPLAPAAPAGEQLAQSR